MELKVICQICREEIAIIDTEEIKYPLTGKMFKSKAPQYEIRAPFHESFRWEEFRCLYGPHRPMLKDDQILTDKGLLNVPREDGEEIFFTEAPKEIGQESVFDGPFGTPLMSEAEAEALVRASMKKENKQNVETDAQQEQPEGNESLKEKEEDKGKAADSGNAALSCPHCPGKQFRNKSGLINHMRLVHKEKVSS